MPNRLARASSPYLLQHQNNPVDWFPWGEEAFAEARRRDVPVFLSIGYSTCYWCHVMERESFEHEPTARLMNERFVCVKVDREERPDVDEVYMAATQMMTGRGGWPMSVFLEPERLRPFWCGTYFPREPRGGMSSFRQVLEGMSDAWRERREDVLRQAEAVAEAVREHLGVGDAGPAPIGAPQVGRAVEGLLRMFDATNGGFGGGGSGGPKFPQAVFPQFLLDARRVVDEQTRRSVDHALRFTLDRMLAGGIRDHVGGGFHRYAVDAVWLVPHFEKMLYDQALLALVYAEAAEAYRDAEYAAVARSTIAYVLREMTDPRTGAFSSAQDAEVDGREGLNYLWLPEEFDAALPEEDAEFARRVYGLDRGPNFRDPHHPPTPDEPARNVLRLDDRPDRLAERFGMEPEAFRARLHEINRRLLAVRMRRRQPHLDDKAVTAWNGMMIAAIARASLLPPPEDAEAGGRASESGDPWLEAARRAADFLLEHLTDERVSVRRSWRGDAGGGQAGPMGVLEDAAWAVAGLVGLARAVRERGHGADPEAEAARLLAGARQIADRAVEDFGAPDGGFFDTRAGRGRGGDEGGSGNGSGGVAGGVGGGVELFVRARSTYDGATPSGSSVMVHALLDLHEALREFGQAAGSAPEMEVEGEPYLERAVAALRALSPAVAGQTLASVNACRALLRMLTLREGGDRVREALGASAALDAAQAEEEEAEERRRQEDFTPVEIYADTDRVRVKPDEPAGFTLVLRIAEGYHINAGDLGGAESGAGGLLPLRVGLVSGRGVRVYADYPPGHEFAVPTPEGDRVERIRVYEREVEIRVALEHAPEIGVPGAQEGETPILGVTFQACTATECLEPRTAELAVAVDLG